MRTFHFYLDRMKKCQILIILCLIVQIGSNIKAENSILYFDQPWTEGDKLAIYYKTTWGNTTIEISDNSTKLELYEYNFSQEYEVAGEGHSRWWFNATEGVHIIEAEIFHQNNIQLIVTKELRIVSYNITFNITSESGVVNGSVFNLLEWLSSLPLYLKIICPIAIVVSVTILGVVVRHRSLDKGNKG